MSSGTQQIEFLNVHRYSNAGRLGFDSDNPPMAKRHGGSTQRDLRWKFQNELDRTAVHPVIGRGVEVNARRTHVSSSARDIP